MYKENCIWATKAGQTHNRSATKLTEEAIMAIRWEWPHVSQRVLAERYGVSNRTISKVVRFERWPELAVGHD